MKIRIARWLVGLSMLFLFTGIAVPSHAAAETTVAVHVGRSHYRQHRRHLVVYYRHGRRYRSYR